MATAKSHTASAVLSATQSIFYTQTAEGGSGPAAWRFQPSVDVDIELENTFLGSETIRVLADEDFPLYDPDRSITSIKAQAVTTDGTISIRPLVL